MLISIALTPLLLGMLEKFFKVDFGSKIKPGSVKSGKVGFMSPDSNAKPNPSYRDVCSGRTGFVEVYDLEYDGDAGTFEQLCKHFYMFHDRKWLFLFIDDA